jgi:hypothetical protein
VSARTPSRRDIVDDAAALLRRLLDAVEDGELEATTPRAVALVRRIEGAAVALEAAANAESGGARAKVTRGR